jgi:protein-disulfide isomerase
MNTKKLTVALVLGLVLVAFLYAIQRYQRQTQDVQQQKATQHEGRLVRMHSPVLGTQGAPVTIVEFFDPACEACRAFHPFVKDLLKQYPSEVRLVLRYAPFHQGSAEVVGLLEASRRQNRFVAVLDSVLEAQPQWADHHRPNVELAWQAAERAGLDLQQARADAPAAQAVLQQDSEDLTALGVKRTPTFFVNGRSLPSFGPEQLAALVAEEVAKAKR